MHSPSERKTRSSFFFLSQSAFHHFHFHLLLLLPAACRCIHDAGDGVLDPQEGVVRTYDGGDFLRQADPQEMAWAKKHCRVGRPWSPSQLD